MASPAPGRGDVLIWGQMLGGCGIHRYDRATGAFTSTSLGGVGCGNYGFLDDDGGMVYGDANGITVISNACGTTIR